MTRMYTNDRNDRNDGVPLGDNANGLLGLIGERPRVGLQGGLQLLGLDAQDQCSHCTYLPKDR